MAMSVAGSSTTDVVALFHSSFHPTKGNVIDWSHKTSDDLDLDGIEFSSLPSGLHSVDQDVVYFSKDGYDGVCVFRRRETEEEGQRGARLGAVGLLVGKSTKSRPWRHVSSLKRISDHLEDNPEDWAALKAHYESSLIAADSDTASVWTSWEDELTSTEPEQHEHPMIHLSHFLRILGPSSLTLFKHVLTRRRVLLFTRPSVEPACLLARAASEMCFGHELDRSKTIDVLGMIGLTDIPRLDSDAARQRGWIACTTDAIFLEKPNLYDLLIDLTSPASTSTSRPAFYTSTKVPGSNRYRLQTSRFTFSDLRVWSTLESILQTDAAELAEEGGSVGSEGAVRWTDPSRLYEEVCILCAGLFQSGCRHSNGPPRLEGDEDDHGDSAATPPDVPLLSRAARWSKIVFRRNSQQPDTRTPRETRTTLALLEAFHQHVAFLDERLSGLLPGPSATMIQSPLILTPRDLTCLQLGSFSEADAKFVEWLAEARFSRVVVVRRTWRDLVSAFVTLNW